MKEQVRIAKFGGSSLGNPDALLRVLDIVSRESSKSPLVVVVSAMGDTTDDLLAAADHAAGGDQHAADRVVDSMVDHSTATVLVTTKTLAARGLDTRAFEVTPLVREHFEPLRKLLYGVSLLRQCSRQSLDLILSFGERLSAQVVANLLSIVGPSSLYVDARTWMVTDDTFGNAMVDTTATRARLTELRMDWVGRVPVTTGFIGATPDGRTTTLGRNGSDYTATLLAWALEATETAVYTDSAGVMTADPAIATDAYPLARMTYFEALELANFGARMFHPRTMIPLIRAGVPMRIRSTLRPEDPGTLIDSEGGQNEARPTSVTSLENLALLGIEWHSLTRPTRVAQRILKALADASITVWMENQAAHGQSIGIVVPQEQAEQARRVVETTLESELSRQEVRPPTLRGPVTLLTLVGEAMGQTIGVAGKFFSALGGVGINILASVQGASSRSISAVIAADDTATAVRTVHAAFNFAHQQVSVLLLGKGTVGTGLLDQMLAQEDFLRREHDVSLRVVGIVGSREHAFSESGICLREWPELLSSGKLKPTPSSLLPLLDRMARLPLPILVDCTAADNMEDLYEEALRRGIHVVAANKKPLAVSWERRQRLMALVRTSHRWYRYETTVGASLPVIETLKDLVRTGDRVTLVEGAFSGTLGYLTNEVMQNQPLSTAVRTARDRGYTEPNPQDDLSGLDVARKALILARELGFPAEMEEIRVTPLVPARLLEPMELEGFYSALAGYDSELGQQVTEARDRGDVLRYLARIEPGPSGSDCAISVGPVFVPGDHPAAALKGTEAFVAFTTDRYAAYPLIVRGSGAGGAVTAAGVLADILRIAGTLRGR
jgi:aspartokinase/homoserine dehydrogenase 1